MDFLSEQFKSFLKAGYGDKELHPIQLQEVKRAFYGGAMTGAANPSRGNEIMNLATSFIKEECRIHVETNVKNN